MANKPSIFNVIPGSRKEAEALFYVQGFVDGWNAVCTARKLPYVPCIVNLEKEQYKTLCDLMGTPGADSLEFLEATIFDVQYLPF